MFARQRNVVVCLFTRCLLMSMFTRQRKVAEAPKFAGRLSVPRLLRITADIPFRTSSRSKGQRSRSPWPLWVAVQVTTCRHILWLPQYRLHSLLQVVITVLIVTQSNGSRTTVEYISNRSCNRRIKQQRCCAVALAALDTTAHCTCERVYIVIVIIILINLLAIR